MKKTGLAILLGVTCLFSHVQSDATTASAKTYTLQLKAKADVKIRKTPSSKAKALGTLKKGKKLDVIYFADKSSYYKVKYKGKFGYVPYKNVKEVSPSGKFVGHYYDRMSAGSAGSSHLYIYEQTSKKIKYVVYSSYKNGSGIYAPYNYEKYKGAATLLSSKTARVQIKGCTGTLKLVGSDIEPVQNGQCSYSNRAFSAIVPEDGYFASVNW